MNSNSGTPSDIIERHWDAPIGTMKEERERRVFEGFAGASAVPIERDSICSPKIHGLFTLQITGHPDFGLPFGQDRLVPIFLATLAVRQRSQTIRFRSAAQMLDIFGLAKGGKEYRRLVAAFERIFGATIFFGTESTQ